MTCDGGMANVERLGMLHAGMLGYEETAALNRHKDECAECGTAYDRIALEMEAPKVDEDIRRHARGVFEVHRKLAMQELRVSLPEPIEMPHSQLDDIVAGAGESDAAQFLVTGGKLDSLLESLRDKIDSLEQSPDLTPEGEKSFVSFLVRCVEENITEATGGEVAEYEAIRKILDSLETLASGESTGLDKIKFLEEVREAYKEKVENMLDRFKKSAGE